MTSLLHRTRMRYRTVSDNRSFAVAFLSPLARLLLFCPYRCTGHTALLTVYASTALELDRLALVTALESARRYIQTCTAMLILHDIPAQLHDIGRVLAPHIDHVLCQLRATVPTAGRQDNRVWFRLR